MCVFSAKTRQQPGQPFSRYFLPFQMRDPFPLTGWWFMKLFIIDWLLYQAIG